MKHLSGPLDIETRLAAGDCDCGRGFTIDPRDPRGVGSWRWRGAEEMVEDAAGEEVKSRGKRHLNPMTEWNRRRNEFDMS